MRDNKTMSLSLLTLPIVQAECVNEHNSETPHIKYCLLLKAMETFMCHWLFNSLGPRMQICVIT